MLRLAADYEAMAQRAEEWTTKGGSSAGHSPCSVLGKIDRPYNIKVCLPSARRLHFTRWRTAGKLDGVTTLATLRFHDLTPLASSYAARCRALDPTAAAGS